METEYVTSNIGKAVSIELVSGITPSLRRSERGFLEMIFPHTPKVFSVVLAFEAGELRLDPRAFSAKVHAYARTAKTWGRAAEVER